MCSGPEGAQEKRCEAFGVESVLLAEGGHLASETKIVNTLIRATQNGWEIEADPRHGELTIKEHGFEKAKGALDAWRG